MAPSSLPAMRKLKRVPDLGCPGQLQLESKGLSFGGEFFLPYNLIVAQRAFNRDRGCVQTEASAVQPA